MSAVFVNAVGNHWINAAHIVMVDSTDLATLTTGAQVQLCNKWSLAEHSMAFTDLIDCEGNKFAELLEALSEIEKAIRFSS